MDCIGFPIKIWGKNFSLYSLNSVVTLCQILNYCTFYTKLKGSKSSH